ncbi:MAG: HPr family phosphocarrier protein [Candidatus Omnitrophota bacterium]|nr:HPr family phosphocarrier protein [Candidatus Omnitrophota bacterium]MDZ4241291.1 HPr family phosphocarrier protein [Candidatus Omnitrophota bacterium]
MPRIEKEIVIQNAQGLHARPAALFVQIASKYDSHITICKDKESVNGKSIMGILMLGAQQNTKVIIIADGGDAELAVTELEGFLTKNE